MDMVVTILDLIHKHNFCCPWGHWGKNFIIFGVENVSSRHTDNRKKYIPDEPTEELDDTCFVNITKSRKKKLFECTLQCDQ